MLKTAVPQHMAPPGDEALLQRVLESSIDAINTLDLQGRLLSMNARSRELLGVDDGQSLLNTNWCALWKGEYRYMAEDAMAAAAEGGVGAFEALRPSAGGPRWCEVTVTPIRDAYDRPERLLTVCRDITGRKQSEEALRQQKEWVDKLLSVIPCSVFWKDRNLVYQGCNRMFAQAAGLSETREIAGKSDFDLPWTKTQADAYRERDRSVISSGLPMVDIEETQRKADGSQVHIVTSKVPVRDAGGAVVGVLGIYNDITARKWAEDKLSSTTERLAASERFARATVDALTAHIAILDDEGNVLAVNRAWREFGQANPPAPSGFAVGANYLSVCESATTGPCGEDARAVAAGIREVLAGTCDVFSREYACHSPVERRWFVARVSRFAGEGPVRVVVAHENVTERRLAEDRLRHDSLHDALTGLPNRVLFADRVERCIERARRNPDYEFAVLFLDLDRFKVINDSLGHAAGDELLTTVAARLQHCLRATDSVRTREEMQPEQHTVARMGGDEFTILLDELRGPDDAARVAERILRTVTQPMEFGGHEVTTTASVGIVPCGSGKGQYTSAKDLLRDADTAMYRAKSAGKARYAVFDSTMHDTAVARLRLESDLRRAVERNELVLYYQPIVSLQTLALEGFEALVRWRREGKLVSPAEFIPIAEDTGLIVSVGAWVMREACRQLALWRKQYPHLPVSMSINLSRRQLPDPGLVPLLTQVLHETGVDPGSVKLEITESVIMDDSNAAREVLSALKETGVKFSMDDFGTGYSSLSCLHRFPIDVLKIDRAFLGNLGERRNAAAVVQAIVSLAHSMGMKVVAEGLETAEQMAFLRPLDCDYGQGYLFARPLPVEEAERFITAARAAA